MAVKKDLTPIERLQVAFMHIVLGVEQHTLAAGFGTNGGRINETVQAVRMAIADPKKIRPNYGKSKKKTGKKK